MSIDISCILKLLSVTFSTAGRSKREKKYFIKNHNILRIQVIFIATIFKMFIISCSSKIFKKILVFFGFYVKNNIVVRIAHGCNFSMRFVNHS